YSLGCRSSLGTGKMPGMCCSVFTKKFLPRPINRMAHIIFIRFRHEEGLKSFAFFVKMGKSSHKKYRIFPAECTMYKTEKLLEVILSCFSQEVIRFPFHQV